MSLRVLLSDLAATRLTAALGEALAGRAHRIVTPGDAQDADIAFVSRDVTGLSTKHEILPATQVFYDALDRCSSLRWVHTHSAGADRAIYQRLLARGVEVTTSSGSNAVVVAHSAIAGVLALARRLPALWEAQRERRWAPLFGSGQPRDLQGQTALVVGWGPIARNIGALLQALGLQVIVARHSDAAAGDGLHTVRYDGLPAVLPRADWLLIACPLSDATRQLIGARELALLPAGACIVNVARGEIVDEAALIAALESGALGGAFLDVFAHEPLPAASPLWSLPNVIATPHSAGFSDGNAARVTAMFLDNLRLWQRGEPLHHSARLPG